MVIYAGVDTDGDGLLEVSSKTGTNLICAGGGEGGYGLLTVSSRTGTDLIRAGADVYDQRTDGSTKGDWDVGIAVDMLDLAPRVETVVLASGDGDYAPVVGKMVDELGIVVEVYGAQDLTAGLLARRATRFVPIQGQMLLPIPTSW